MYWSYPWTQNFLQKFFWFPAGTGSTLSVLTAFGRCIDPAANAVRTVPSRYYYSIDIISEKIRNTIKSTAQFTPMLQLQQLYVYDVRMMMIVLGFIWQFLETPCKCVDVSLSSHAYMTYTRLRWNNAMITVYNNTHLRIHIRTVNL